MTSAKADYRTPEIFNIGTGEGVGVLEVHQAYENLVGRKVPFKVLERRTGDTGKANQVLGWKAEFDLNAMVQTAWQWERTLAINKTNY